MATLFKTIYGRFFSKITDDMYLEYTEYDTNKDCQLMLINCLPKFEFPKQNLSYVLLPVNTGDEEDPSYFDNDLDSDEQNILATLMMIEWLQRQITSIENTAQKFYGNSFKLTSQANHLDKLLKLKENCTSENLYLQRLYKRRKINSDGTITSAWSDFNTYN